MRLPAERIPSIPGPVRAVMRNAVWGFGRATAARRPLPDFLVIGAQKAGTTALYAYLSSHPAIVGPSWKEVSFFDRHWARGERWYRGNFPVRAHGRIVGEASPSYLLHPLAAERVASLVPEVRLVVLLREPGARAYSHYMHEVALGREPLSFEGALDAEDVRISGEIERMVADPRYFSRSWWDHTYTARGRYAEQLERWLSVFPAEQLLVLTTEALAADTALSYQRVLAHIGAPSLDLGSYPRIFERAYAPMAPATRSRLDHAFLEPNRQLSELLGWATAWTRSP
jgi:hypothetical protein